MVKIACKHEKDLKMLYNFKNFIQCPKMPKLPINLKNTLKRHTALKRLPKIRKRQKLPTNLKMPLKQIGYNIKKFNQYPKIAKLSINLKNTLQ